MNEETKCPKCGTEQENARLYTCPECNEEMFDCCIAGNNVKCFDCEDAEEEEE